MPFPKPSFADLLASYLTDPESVHDCPAIYTKNPISVNTCAIRMSEALSIASGLVATREAIAALTHAAGAGHGLLLGRYGYQANLCPHGCGRGAHDVARFLEQQWGAPTFSFTARLDAPDAIGNLTGVLAFIGIPTYEGQGHLDVWNMQQPVGHAYWSSETVLFWQLD